MQITRETDYAIRCVHFLSSAKERTLIVDKIAEQMCIPKTILAKILQKLVKAGLVKSFRGAKGGCQLTRKPADITLLDVIEAIQGVSSTGSRKTSFFFNVDLKKVNSYKSIIIGRVNAISFVFMAQTAEIRDSRYHTITKRES